MKGILFDDFEVELDDRLARPMGGSWQGPKVGKKLTAWDPDTLRLLWQAMLKLDMPIVLDIGASTGGLCLLAKFVDVARVMAFEPMPLACSILRHNVQLNELEDFVEVYEKALSDKNGHESVLKIPERKNAGMATLGTPRRFKKWSTHKVTTRTLDSFRIDQVHLVKIDAEGAELSILLGGEETIRSWMPPILFESERTNISQFGHKVGQLTSLLQSWGYRHFERIGKEDVWATT